jgi:lipopolysaccharide heptosyltransferase II
MKILFIKLGALGDVINTLPLAITLHEQLDAHIHWLVEPLSYPLVSSHSSVERAILFDKKHWPRALGGVLKELQSEKFDIALDLQRLIKSGLFCMVSQSARRIGFDKARCKEFTWLFPFERIPASDPTMHMVNQYLDFARYLGVIPSEIRWDIPITGQISLDIPKKYVVLNIGATTSAKRWSAAGFATLASGLLDRYAVQGVLTGGPGDIRMAQEIESLAEGRVMNLVGQTSFQDLAEIISGAAAIVTCDTGPMHLAVALGKEVVALIGPTNPTRTGPLRGRIVRQYLDCMPCNKRRCEDPVCMRGITAEMVLDALEEIL